jgi:hypothetical protein
MGGFWNHEGRTELRSKNNPNDLVDWDLNIYKDPSEETEFWFITPYVYDEGDTLQYGKPFMLTMPEALSMMHKNEYFDNQDEVWYGMKGFLFDYWDKLSDRVRFFLESLPKYTDDLDGSMLQ